MKASEFPRSVRRDRHDRTSCRRRIQAMPTFHKLLIFFAARVASDDERRALAGAAPMAASRGAALVPKSRLGSAAEAHVRSASAAAPRGGWPSSSKTIWLFWAQGWSDLKSQKGKHAADRACVWAWMRLYPGPESGWEVRLLDDDDARLLSPRYAGIRDHPYSGRVGLPLASDALRLDLLSRYGGVWADTSVCPFQRLESWVPEALDAREGLFFPFAFDGTVKKDYAAARMQRSALRRFENCQYASHNAEDSRPLGTFFLAAAEPRDPMIDAWIDALYPRLLEVLATPKKTYPYFLAHCSLTLVRLRNASMDERWRRIRNTKYDRPRVCVCRFEQNKDCDPNYAEKNCPFVKGGSNQNYAAYILSRSYRAHLRGLGAFASRRHRSPD